MTDPNLAEDRDSLALVRTDLANERTLLAYGRTALLLAGTGVSMIEFLERSPLVVAGGWILVVLGGVVGATGMLRFARLHLRLRRRD